jgi:putative heme-binding domain-containing protein
MMRAVLALARGRQRAGRSFESLRAAGSPALIESLLAQAKALAAGRGPVERRVIALRLLGLADPSAVRELFPTLLDARQPSAVQLAVLQTFAGHFDRDAARQIMAQWKSLSPGVRREAVEVLFSRREGIESVIGAIESGAILPAELDPARLQQLQTHSNPALRARAQKILAQDGSTSRDRNQVVASYRPALELAGDRDRGRDVFAKTCATCHQAEGRGVDVGPNLATVTNRSPEDLLVHILDPNREVAPNFVNYNVATESGRIISGIIAEESAGALVLKRAEGAGDVIPREQIEEVASTGISLMPEGLEKGLSASDLADLIAFVRSIKPAAPAPAAGR